MLGQEVAAVQPGSPGGQLDVEHHGAALVAAGVGQQLRQRAQQLGQGGQVAESAGRRGRTRGVPSGASHPARCRPARSRHRGGAPRCRRRSAGRRPRRRRPRRPGRRARHGRCFAAPGWSPSSQSPRWAITSGLVEEVGPVGEAGRSTPVRLGPEALSLQGRDDLVPVRRVAGFQGQDHLYLADAHGRPRPAVLHGQQVEPEAGPARPSEPPAPRACRPGRPAP